MASSHPSLLFLAHRIPYPPNKGDKIRSFNEINHLSRTHAIDLIATADTVHDLNHVKDLKRYCRRVEVSYIPPAKAKIRGLIHLVSGKPISTAYFYDRRIQQQVDTCLANNRYKAIVCFSSPMAEYLFRSRVFRKNDSRLIMDFCDVDSEKWIDYSRETGFPMSLIYRLEGKRLLQYEKRINRWFDHSVFVSDREKDLYCERDPGARNVLAIHNGVDSDYFAPVGRSAPDGSGPTLLFTGAMDYFANIDGVLWFASEVFPLVKQVFPTARFMIAGRNPPASVQKLNRNPDVVVTGFVPDMRDCYREADLCVIPLRIARGIQNKVLEAMAMATPVVATSAALAGINARDQQHLLVADSPRDFARQVIHLLSSGGIREQIVHEALALVRSQYNWSVCLSPFNRLLAG